MRTPRRRWSTWCSSSCCSCPGCGSRSRTDPGWPSSPATSPSAPSSKRSSPRSTRRKAYLRGRGTTCSWWPSGAWPRAPSPSGGSAGRPTAIARLRSLMAVQISPSILSADFARLADEAEAVAGVADWVHVDVMDNHFVPNLTLGLPVVESLLKHAALPLDCHLMISEPDRWAPGYAEAGARNVTIHAEAARAPVRTLRAIRAAGARAGLAINPGTPVEHVT